MSEHTGIFHTRCEVGLSLPPTMDTSCTRTSRTSYEYEYYQSIVTRQFTPPSNVDDMAADFRILLVVLVGDGAHLLTSNMHSQERR